MESEHSAAALLARERWEGRPDICQDAPGGASEDGRLFVLRRGRVLISTMGVLRGFAKNVLVILISFWLWAANRHGRVAILKRGWNL